MAAMIFSVKASPRMETPIQKNRKTGCGMLVVNPPFGFEAQTREALAFLALSLAQGAAGGVVGCPAGRI